MTKIFLIVMMWLCLGIVAVASAIVYDMRGQEFKEDYFDEFSFLDIIMVISLGPISLIAFLLSFSEEKKPKNRKSKITKTVWDIANLGVKKDE